MNQIELETWIHGYQVPKTPTETESFLPTKIQNNKKLLPYIGGILLTLLVVFVLRKQYPLEFQNMLGNKQNIENPLPQEIEEPSINEDDEEIPEEIAWRKSNRNTWRKFNRRNSNRVKRFLI
jgi:hypothetical protein